MHSDVISSDEVDGSIMTGTRGAINQFNDQMNETRGVMFNQGLQDSVLAGQVGLDERQELADSLNTNALDLKSQASKENREARTVAEDQFNELKIALAERKKQIKEQGFANMIDGATGVVGFMNEPKYLASLGNKGTPMGAPAPVMGYTNTSTTGGQFGQGQSALNFGQPRALGGAVLPPQVNTGQQSIAPKTTSGNPYAKYSNASDRVAKRKKKGSAFRTTTYSRNANRGQ